MVDTLPQPVQELGEGVGPNSRLAVPKVSSKEAQALAWECQAAAVSWSRSSVKR